MVHIVLLLRPLAEVAGSAVIVFVRIGQIFSTPPLNSVIRRRSAVCWRLRGAIARRNQSQLIRSETEERGCKRGSVKELRGVCSARASYMVPETWAQQGTSTRKKEPVVSSTLEN